MKSRQAAKPPSRQTRFLLFSAAGLLVASIQSQAGFASASSQIGDNTGHPSRRYETLRHLLESAPAPPAAQDLANELMAKYESDPNFADVVITADKQIVVALKGAAHGTATLDGIQVTTMPALVSLNEFDELATEISESNPSIDHLSMDFLRSEMTIGVGASSDSLQSFDASAFGVPDDVTVVIRESRSELDAAAGGMLSNGSGCTTGFRVKSGQPPVWRLTSANHSTCATWTTVNGVAMTYQGGVCGIDTSIASGNNLSLAIDGMPFGNVQGNPASGAQVYKYGVTTGWTFGVRGAATVSTFSCDVPVYKYTGGNIASQGGDSGGPYISISGCPNSCVYHARGTHRGTISGVVVGVRMGNINAAGFTVG